MIRKIFRKKNLSISAILIGLILCVSIPTTAYPENQTINTTIDRADHTVYIENTSAWPGTMMHSINITAKYSTEIFGFVVEFDYQTINDNEAVPVEINFDGCIDEDPYYDAITIVHDLTVTVIKVTVLLTDTWTPGNGVPAGEGKLFNLVVNISETAQFQTIVLSDGLFSSPPQFYTLSGGTALLVPGYLELFRTPNPPTPPSQPTGQTHGSVGVSYTYAVTGVGSMNYRFDFGDGTFSDWTAPVPGEPYAASKTYTAPGEYQVKAQRKNTYDEESNWSESLTVSISSLVVTSISGGPGITISLKNVGPDEVTNIECTAEITGGLFVFPKQKTKTIPSLAPDEIAEFKMFVLGIGLGLNAETPLLTFTAQAEGESYIQTVDEVVIILFYVVI